MNKNLVPVTNKRIRDIHLTTTIQRRVHSLRSVTGSPAVRFITATSIEQIAIYIVCIISAKVCNTIICKYYSCKWIKVYEVINYFCNLVHKRYAAILQLFFFLFISNIFMKKKTTMTVAINYLITRTNLNMFLLFVIINWISIYAWRWTRGWKDIRKKYQQNRKMSTTLVKYKRVFFRETTISKIMRTPLPCSKVKKIKSDIDWE